MHARDLAIAISKVLGPWKFEVLWQIDSNISMDMFHMSLKVFQSVCHSVVCLNLFLVELSAPPLESCQVTSFLAHRH